LTKIKVTAVTHVKEQELRAGLEK